MERTRKRYTPRDVRRHITKIESCIKKAEKLRKRQREIQTLILMTEETHVQLTMKTERIFEEVKTSCQVDLRECAICLAEFGLEETELSFASCRHLFHHICLTEWQKINNTCPCCREDMSDAAKVSAYHLVVARTLFEFAKAE